MDERHAIAFPTYRYKCDECKEFDPPTSVDHKSGDAICLRCGLVLAERMIDFYSEWRSFSNDDRDEKVLDRIGAPTNPYLSGGGIRTVVGKKDHQGRTISVAPTNPALRVHLNYALNSADRSILEAQDTIKTLSGRLDLTQPVQSIAMDIFAELTKKAQLRGQTIDALATACVIKAAQKTKANRTINEICRYSSHPKKKILKALKFITKITGDHSEPVPPDTFIPRYCNELRLTKDVTDAAIETANTINDLGLLGSRNLITICSAAIFCVARLTPTPKSFKEIAEVTGITDQTIRSSVRELEPNITRILPKDWVARDNSFPGVAS